MLGSITVSFSDDFFGDLTGIACALDSCGDWSAAGGGFTVDDTVRYAPAETYGPLLRPSRIVAIRLRRFDGAFVWVDPAVVTYAEALATLEARREVTSLAEISERVSSSLLSGSLRIDCWRRNADLPRHRGSLEIHAGGAVVSRPASDDRTPGAVMHETFDPASMLDRSVSSAGRLPRLGEHLAPDG